MRREREVLATLALLLITRKISLANKRLAGLKNAMNSDVETFTGLVNLSSFSFTF